MNANRADNMTKNNPKSESKATPACSLSEKTSGSNQVLGEKHAHAVSMMLIWTSVAVLAPLHDIHFHYLLGYDKDPIYIFFVK